MPTWRIYVFGLVIVAMVVSFAYLRLSKQTLSVTNPEPIAIERTVIADAALLEKTNPVFYGGAKDGDVVLRYEDHLELYRPFENRVIRSAPIAK
ncbi:hypothetical protein K8R04_00730 [Candidatus Uhrbacteria bacterium]|nr:hypothetical protein [Candidatus Uhrbacteria bacterium]